MMRTIAIFVMVVGLSACANLGILPKTEALTTDAFRITYTDQRPGPAQPWDDQSGGSTLRERVTKSLPNMISPIYFESGKSQIPEGYITSLRSIVTSLADKQNLRLKFIGHTDNALLSGAVANLYGDNEGLSKHRAQQVAGFVAEGLGIDKSQTIVEGYGPDRPVASNENASGKRLNRRVEVEVLYDEIISQPVRFSGNRLPGSELMKTSQITLSAGDRIRVMIPEGEEFSGIFEIDLDGTLHLPYLRDIDSVGKTITELAGMVEDSLVLKGYFKRSFVDVTITPLQWAQTNILVKGAVNNPGYTLINDRKNEEMEYDQEQQSGDFAYKRLLSSALRAAGGIAPDANLKDITLTRNGLSYAIDLSGMLSGEKSIDPILVDGDLVIVPSVGYLQEALLRPSRLTAPGFRTYISNLSIGAGNNTGASVGKYTNNLPPGSRLLTAAMSGNCVGGTVSVNAARHVILVGKDPVTDSLRVMRRSLKQMLDGPNQDLMNPYLLPEDHIACFDSEFTNLRDIGRALSDFLGPLKILIGDQGL